jgi:Cft2 family RNA processing exonuclease
MKNTSWTSSQQINEEDWAENRAKFREELKAALAPQGPPFIPLTAAKLRELANAMRKRQGLPPLPEPV